MNKALVLPIGLLMVGITALVIGIHHGVGWDIASIAVSVLALVVLFAMNREVTR